MPNTVITLPLTSAQQSIWMGHQFDPQRPTYNVASYIEIAGVLDNALLAQALRRAVQETEALRACYSEQEGSDGDACQWIQEDVVFSFPLRDLTGMAEPRVAAREWMGQDLALPIDLVRGELFSTSLIRINDQLHWFYFKTHHIAVDGFGLAMVFRRVAEIYTRLVARQEISVSSFGSIQELLDSDCSYRDSKAFLEDRDYWHNKCANGEDLPSFTSEVDLPSGTAITHCEMLSPSAVRQLDAMADQAGVHWVHVLIAAFASFLSRTTGRKQIVLAIPFLNRIGTTAIRVPATVTNVLPLHLEIHPKQSIRAVCEEVSERLASVRKHQRYRAEDIRRDCNLLGENRRLTGPAINIDMFTDSLSFAGSPGITRLLSAGPVEDLSFLIQRGADDAIELIGMVNPSLYSETSLHAHMERFLDFLARFTEDENRSVGQLDAFTQADLQFFFEGVAFGGQAIVSEHQETITSLFERHAAATPEAIALTFNGLHLSYAELNGRANQLAHEIRATVPIHGNPLIALLLQRGVSTVVAIIAALKLGAGYVPMDPDAPITRINQILADTEPVLLVTDLLSVARLEASSCKRLVLDEPSIQQSIASRTRVDVTASLNIKPSPDDLAYIIFTSGSTGVPKGVKITHNNVVRLFSSTDKWFKFSDNDVWTHCFSYYFDASIWEIWGALLYGSRVVMVPVEITRAPEQLLELVVKEHVNVFGLNPSAFYRFLDACQDHSELNEKLKLRYLSFGAEALDLTRLKPWIERHPVGNPPIINMYGITETTVNATYHYLSEAEISSSTGSMIGKPLHDLRIMVLDDALRPVPIGGYGEMYVAGAGLAKGYLNRPDLDAVRFVANPFGEPGTRMYRSGDVAMLHPGSVLEFIGRADQQVKIRGFRIELGEVEAHLREHPAVSDAVASVKIDAVGDPRLIAHVVPRLEGAGSASIDVPELLTFLRDRLPSYMVPSAIGCLASLPFTANGKVDRKGLPDILVDLQREVEAARDSVDERVLAAWRKQLQIDGLGLDDHFFELGGDSIKAIRVCRELEIPVMVLFKDPTPRACSEHLRGQATGGAQQQTKLLYHFNKGEVGQPHLLCVPFAGGNAFTFRQLADQLGSTVACSAINPPGHDPTQESDDFMDIETLAEQVVKEILAEIHGPLVIYGHCAGNALAIAVAKELQAKQANLALLVIGGMLLDRDCDALLDSLTKTSGLEILEYLRQIGGFKEALDPKTTNKISRMTKFDCMQSAAFFADESKRARKGTVPIQVIVGDQDPLTGGYREKYLDWQAYSDCLSLSVIEGGGHYFVQDNAKQLAAVLEQCLCGIKSAIKGRVPRSLREFCNPFDDAEAQFYLLNNQAGQCSLWPAFAMLPAGWSRQFGPGSRGECLQLLERDAHSLFAAAVVVQS